MTISVLPTHSLTQFESVCEGNKNESEIWTLLKLIGHSVHPEGDLCLVFAKGSSASPRHSVHPEGDLCLVFAKGSSASPRGVTPGPYGAPRPPPFRIQTNCLSHPC